MAQRYDFGGTIGTTVETSSPWWPPVVRPPKAAPNIVMVVLDDVGFAQLGCYGSNIATPVMDGLAANGLRYNNFHVTALCSPTRAALLTGRNHHSAGMGLVSNFDNGFPGYRGYVAHETATIAELLHDYSYVNYCVGKWHLAPPRDTGPLGPFDHWPLGRGFDHYYGFLHGRTNQWVPNLWHDNHSIEPPTDRDGYHLTEDLVDHALANLRDWKSANSARPFFLYLAFGACHDPHHVPEEFIERYAGAFDDGWDVERDRVLARQMEMGVVPASTKLPPANPGVRAWSDLNADERRLFARMQEVFAGFLTHTDHHLGRLIDFLTTHDLLDDTLLILLSDNGASMEGGAVGSINIQGSYRLGRTPTIEDNLEKIDVLGGPLTDNHYPTGWAQAGNTPLRYYKIYTHGGGIRAPLILHWPRRITEGTGSIRFQYHHAIDVVPTILGELGIDAPDEYRGVAQLPIHGTSLAYTFDSPDAPTMRETQYYEIHGNRGIWHRGWKAVTTHHLGGGTDFAADRWELYNLDEDFSEYDDLANANPEKLTELVSLWWAEAGRYGVLPLEDRLIQIAKGDPGRDPEWKDCFSFLPGAFIPDAASCPDFFNRAFTINAVVEHVDAAEGVLFAFGDRFAGFVLFVQGGQLLFDYNGGGRHSVIESSDGIAAGARTLSAKLDPIRPGVTRATLVIDGAEAGTNEVTPTMLSGVSMTGIQCGRGFLTPVSDRYENPFPYRGTLREVVVTLEPKEQDADLHAFATVMADQ